MQFIDTHAHLYLDAFDHDRPEVLQRAKDAGLIKILLPNIDSDTIADLHQLESDSNHYCLAMMGLHPCSVKEGFEDELSLIRSQFESRNYIAVGEIGLDFYWDKTTSTWQKEAFHIQVRWASKFNLPIVIHSRDSADDILNLLEAWAIPDLQGVFHCFTGDKKQAQRILDLGFMMGIGGLVTFKNSQLDDIVKDIPLDSIILETDAPYLTPHPHRGQRNESCYIPLIAHEVARAKKLSESEIATMTTENACRLFRL